MDISETCLVITIPNFISMYISFECINLQYFQISCVYSSFVIIMLIFMQKSSDTYWIITHQNSFVYLLSWHQLLSVVIPHLEIRNRIQLLDLTLCTPAFHSFSLQKQEQNPLQILPHTFFLPVCYAERPHLLISMFSSKFSLLSSALTDCPRKR